MKEKSTQQVSELGVSRSRIQRAQPSGQRNALNFLRINELASTKTRTGVLPASKATIWRHSKEGLLPPPIRLGPRITAWNCEEIDLVMSARYRGATDDQIRALVAQLVAARGAK